MDKLTQVKDRLIDEIEEYATMGRLSKDDALTLKALTGSADHLCNIIDKKDGYSGYYPTSYESYDGTGRRSYARRDSMGRYSQNSLTDKLHELMDEAPDDRTRMEIKRLIDKM